MSPDSRWSLASIQRTVLVAVAASVAWAGVSTTSRAELKIGVFDKQRIVDECKAGVAARSRFEKLQAQRESEVAEKQKAFEELEKSFRQKAKVLAPDKRLKMEQDVLRARDEWQAMVNTAGRDLDRAYQSALLELVAKIDPILLEFAQTSGYDLMFDKSQLAWAKGGLDVTDEIIKKVDLVHK